MQYPRHERRRQHLQTHILGPQWLKWRAPTFCSRPSTFSVSCDDHGSGSGCSLCPRCLRPCTRQSRSRSSQYLAPRFPTFRKYLSPPAVFRARHLTVHSAAPSAMHGQHATYCCCLRRCLRRRSSLQRRHSAQRWVRPPLCGSPTRLIALCDY